MIRTPGQSLQESAIELSLSRLMVGSNRPIPSIFNWKSYEFEGTYESLRSDLYAQILQSILCTKKKEDIASWEIRCRAINVLAWTATLYNSGLSPCHLPGAGIQNRLIIICWAFEGFVVSFRHITAAYNSVDKLCFSTKHLDLSQIRGSYKRHECNIIRQWVWHGSSQLCISVRLP